MEIADCNVALEKALDLKLFPAHCLLFKELLEKSFKVYTGCDGFYKNSVMY